MRLALVGGFLGSGKTTAIAAASKLLMQQGNKVAVISNDQGDQQVDTIFYKSFGIPNLEVINGCFCCNYNQLDAHLETLIHQHNPELIFAESVGSCTDLIATIAKPLHQSRPAIDVVVSIFAEVDFLLALMEGRISFLDESVRYIYKKQLEEADLLVLTKTDLVSPQQLEAVASMIKTEYPSKIILKLNSFDSKSIVSWLDNLQQFTNSPERNSLAIDYDVYGEGESRLAWLDKHIIINTTHNNAIAVAHHIIGSVFDHIQEHHYIIGHLKFFLEANNWTEKISFTATSTSADIPSSGHHTNTVRMLINARVQTEPALLEKLVDDVIARTQHVYDCTATTEKWAVFRPGYPQPTHRFV